MNLRIEQKQIVKKIPALVFTRCCGYFSPVYHGQKRGTWNDGKMSEFNDRKYLNIGEVVNAQSSSLSGLQ